LYDFVLLAISLPDRHHGAFDVIVIGAGPPGQGAAGRCADGSLAWPARCRSTGCGMPCRRSRLARLDARPELR
jgi:hypothetical protein